MHRLWSPGTEISWVLFQSLSSFNVTHYLQSLSFLRWTELFYLINSGLGRKQDHVRSIWMFYHYRTHPQPFPRTQRQYTGLISTCKPSETARFSVWLFWKHDPSTFNDTSCWVTCPFIYTSHFPIIFQNLYHWSRYLTRQYVNPDIQGYLGYRQKLT